MIKFIICTMSRKSRIRGAGSHQVHRRIVIVSGQLTKEVRFKLTFKGSDCNRSFDSGRDFTLYLGRTVAEGMLTTLNIHVSDLRSCWSVNINYCNVTKTTDGIRKE